MEQLPGGPKDKVDNQNVSHAATQSTATLWVPSQKKWKTLNIENAYYLSLQMNIMIFLLINKQLLKIYSKITIAKVIYEDKPFFEICAFVFCRRKYKCKTLVLILTAFYEIASVIWWWQGS